MWGRRVDSNGRVLDVFVLHWHRSVSSVNILGDYNTISMLDIKISSAHLWVTDKVWGLLNEPAAVAVLGRAIATLQRCIGLFGRHNRRSASKCLHDCLTQNILGA